MRYAAAILGSASLAAAHGIVKSLVIDGITYPAYDPRLDTEWGVKRVMWEYSNTTGSSRGLGPVMDVSSPDIACRFSPLQAPQIHAVARAGSTISFKWTDWFANHKGPLLTIHESTYDSKTEEWGSDVLIKNNNVMTATIPSDIKPGFYVVRHELISLHFSFRANTTTKVSGAQFFPQCVKVQVLGEGTATPPGVRFPGGYQWDHPGILDNIYYGVNRYPSPGPAVYQAPAKPPVGPPPTVTETGALTGERGEAYAKAKLALDSSFEAIVHADSAKKPGGGGCHWEPGADPSTAKCVATNPGNPAYVGFAQPKGSPMYDPNSPQGRGPGSEVPGLSYPLPKAAPGKIQRRFVG